MQLGQASVPLNKFGMVQNAEPQDIAECGGHVLRERHSLTFTQGCGSSPEHIRTLLIEWLFEGLCPAVEGR